MHIYKAAWLSHEQEPIFSVDVHPDGTRCATGGAGEKTVKNSPLPHLSPRRLRADSQVKIWSLKPLEDEDVEEAGMQQSDEEENEVRLFFSFSPAHSHV